MGNRETQANPVIIVNKEGLIVQSNAAARRVFGQCVGRSCQATVRPVDDEGVVCDRGCPRGSRNQDICWSTVGVGEKVAALQCSAVGDLVVVTLERVAERPGPHQQLTDRERQVLALVGTGLAAPAIATELGIRTSTVRTHIEHCRTKLGARTQAEAIVTAYATHQL